ncbi:hypothetical protein TELCIR_14163 [Teladorsagia circumcincta]|uniref:Uncharacterized protein n=1 Tax=Teladorsagia circumcincta TaxID=45464 RepID=A0A2G9U1U0_TELCI|nr:hypothetical protein TELCIR_14163 [Teladorsagia circumcincta]
MKITILTLPNSYNVLLLFIVLILSLVDSAIDEGLCSVEDVEVQANQPDDQIVPESPLPVDTRDRFSPVLPGPTSSGGPNQRPFLKPVAQISPMKTAKNSSKNRSRSPPFNMELEETPPDFDAELVNLSSTKTSRLSSTSSSEEATKYARVSEGRRLRTVDKLSPSTTEDLTNTRKRPSTTRVQR